MNIIDFQIATIKNDISKTFDLDPDTFLVYERERYEIIFLDENKNSPSKYKTS